ncbi:SDR family oxidoreductase [Stigmatella aurantiaca]|uniref:Carbonyl reductase [NADPH] 1 (Nadph-dependent carbonylreductase 1) n=1 Tax=Stigmatella aurantiaca (strain DW4/3-1) TaxID=378806 RepID=Q097P7_STIAD|nr:SDR family oxidoreductase [Stigmatella aurantiaca]ADO75784.1 Carbonyl reductase [NADPH] 1 (Nadph-dependent carbonylreductase 1) [Stigmatella aurantiaca DW4/3-1]EAU67968.1 carbonyl reductase [NADPH] 1 (nadph-dependent carbonylreductase 1) (20-beta-hydroxysteroid dehydrogenase) (prostaglandin-e(2) 9-reductase) [Stigmatella aurantiaca DW4/3-1]
MDTPQIALVTGANRGLGLELCKQLAARGTRVLLTARSEEKGQKAARALAEQGLPVSFLWLDVTSEQSLVQGVEYISREFGRLDILVNNAAVSLDLKRPGLEIGMDIVRTTIETNVYGPLRLTQLAVPLMRKNHYGRIVNVSSGLGSFSRITAGKLAYRLSKASLNTMTKVFADELQDTNILVNAVTPGWVRTHLGGIRAERSVEEGVDSILWLATLPDDGPRGKFFKDRNEFPW